MAEPSPFMQRALDAAHSVRGTTSPNPNVGAVVVRDGKMVAVGATSPPGGPHAEAAALATAGGLARGADVYVTLEPCFPFPGKRTPPCSQALIDAGVRRVIVAIEDADPAVRGNGISLLKSHGIEVEVGDGAGEATRLLRHYIKHRQARLPYVIAKFAASLDGRTATASGDSKWITGEGARDRAHEERAWVDAIMVGSGTVIADDPSLTARPGGQLGAHQPVRVVLDARGRTPADAALFQQPGHTIVATSAESHPDWRRSMAVAGAQVMVCERDDRGLNLDQLLAALGERGIVSIWAEGGATLLGSLFDGNHVDELYAFLAPVLIGSLGRPAVDWPGFETMAEALRLRDVTIEPLPPDVLIRGYTGSWEPR